MTWLAIVVGFIIATHGQPPEGGKTRREVLPWVIVYVCMIKGITAGDCSHLNPEQASATVPPSHFYCLSNCVTGRLTLTNNE